MQGAVGCRPWSFIVDFGVQAEPARWPCERGEATTSGTRPTQLSLSSHRELVVSPSLLRVMARVEQFHRARLKLRIAVSERAGLLVRELWAPHQRWPLVPNRGFEAHIITSIATRAGHARIVLHLVVNLDKAQNTRAITDRELTAGSAFLSVRRIWR